MRIPRPGKLSPALVLVLTGAGLVLPVAPAQAATAYQVTAKVNRTSIDYGQSLRISGKVTQGPVKGRQVTVYWTRTSQDDSWHKIGQVPLSRKGTFAKRYKPRSGGDIKFKVVKSKVGRHAAGNAVTGTSAVYQWQSLWGYWNNGIGVDDGNNGATATRGPATIHGKTYASSLVVNDTANVDFTTYECKAVRGLVGMTQGSEDTSGQLLFGVLFPFAVVEVAREHSAVSFGADLDPDDPLRIGAQIPGGDDGGTDDAMVLARPQVLCNAPA